MYGLDDPRAAGIVAENPPQCRNTTGQHVIRNKHVGPHRRDQLLFADNAWMLGEVNQRSHGFRFHASTRAVARNLVQCRTDQPLAYAEVAIHLEILQRHYIRVERRWTSSPRP